MGTSRFKYLQHGEVYAADFFNQNESAARSCPARSCCARLGQPRPMMPTLPNGLQRPAYASCKSYQAVGYDYARAWFSLEEKKLVWIYVDPGHMRVLFVGVGGVGAALFRLSLNLPNDVFYKPTVEHALQELKQKYSLVNISYQVRDVSESQITPFGSMVPNRLLQIYVVSREFLGWSLDVSVGATWGVVPGVSYQHANLLLDDDRLFTKVEFAFPYRQYLAEEEPRLRWVHGGFDAAYRLPRRMQGLLALRLETSLYLSLYDRPDLAIETYDFLRSTTVPALVLLRPNLEVSLGAGADVVSIFRVQRVSDGTTDSPSLGDLKSVRALVRMVAKLDPHVRVAQRDQRPWVNLQIDAASSNIQRWLLVTSLTGQSVISVGRHRFILRGRGVALAGDVRFWDEMQLAGDYQRVFFGNRYWVHQAAQVETAYRVHLWRDWFALGVFHDTSLFDGSQPAHPSRQQSSMPSDPACTFCCSIPSRSIGLSPFYRRLRLISPVGFDQTRPHCEGVVFAITLHGGVDNGSASSRPALSHRMRQADHPLHAEAIGAHAEIRTPGRVGQGHRDPATGAERGEYAVGLGLVVGDDRDVKVVAERDGWTEALDHVACHEVHRLRDRELRVHDLGLCGVGTFGMNDVSPKVCIMAIFVPKTVS
jgi:hypothetical protein